VLLETIDVWRKDHPGKRRLGEDVPIGFEPIGIVEGTAAYALHGREPLEQETQMGAALRAEIDSQHTPVVERAMIVGGDCAALEFDICCQEYRLHQKRASGQALTESAVANRRSFRIAGGSIPDVPAKAAAVMDFRHLLPPIAHLQTRHPLIVHRPASKY
jgi:hypothetical protein